ncbi:MAG: flagellar motor protein MotB [Spirochaetales bacterium]|nr:flagellar motor protein MotB [Spirochaetales bacterium]
MPFKRKKKAKEEGSPYWMITYGDMTTLLLVFFVVMFTTAEIDGSELRMILAAFQGLGVMRGGNTLQVGKLAELGNNIMTLPSVERGRALDKARKLAKSIFETEISVRKVRIKEDERGLIISLSAELFFDPASAILKIEEARPILYKVRDLLRSEEVRDKKVRIEGHTDDVAMDEDSEYPTNWDLSAARSLEVLKYLIEYGVPEQNMQVAGYADTVPVSDNNTEEGRADNRRVDIVILTEGHL